MPVAETLGNLAWVAVFGIGFGLLVLVVGFILYNILNKKRERGDTLKEMYLEMKHDAKLNMPDHMRDLYRVPIPFLGDFVEKIGDKEERQKTMDELRVIFSQHKRAVHLGEIVGFNRIDLLATVEDILMPDSKMADVLKLDKEDGEVTQKAIDDIIALVEECGRYLNFIVYQPKKRKLLDFPREEGVLACSDMILGLESDDGKVCLLGEGTDSLITGGYFSIPSGYPHRIKVILTYLIERGWIRFAMRLQSVMIEVVEEGMRMDTQSQKIMSITALGNAGMGARKPELGNPMNK